MPRERLIGLDDGVAVLAQAEARRADIEDLCRQRTAEAEARGYETGWSNGREAAEAEAGAFLRTIVHDLAAFQAAQRDAVGRLAVDVVRNLLGDIGEDRALEPFVLRRLDDLRDEQPLEIRAPAGAARRLSEALRRAGLSLRVVEDLSLGSDACVFVLGAGSAHASIGTHLRRFEDSIAELCAEASDVGGR